MRAKLLSISAMIIVATSAVALANPFAKTFADEFSPPVAQLSSSDIHLHTQRSFFIADADRDGLVDQVEFASFAVVMAEISQFSGFITIEGNRPVRIKVPIAAGTTINIAGRDAIYRDAERLFHDISAKSGPMNEIAWLHYRLGQFEDADFDADGMLKEDELSHYAAQIIKTRAQNS